MRPHPRIRKTVKWAGAVVCVVLVALWIGSGWWYVGYNGQSGTYVGAIGGNFGVGHASQGGSWWTSFGLFGFRNDASFSWWYFRWDDGPWGWSLTAPLWVLMAPMLLATGAAWWHDRRVPPGFCRKCRYDLSGLREGAVCPECGTAAASVEMARMSDEAAASATAPDTRTAEGEP